MKIQIPIHHHERAHLDATEKKKKEPTSFYKTEFHPPDALKKNGL